MDNQLKLILNSNGHTLKFTDELGKPIIYTLKRVYKENNKYKYAEVWSEFGRFLVTADSLKNMILKGYVENAIFDSKRHITVQGRNNQNSKGFRIIDMDKKVAGKYSMSLDKLEDKLNIESIKGAPMPECSTKKLNINGIVFSVCGKPIAMCVANKDEQENSKKFLRYKSKYLADEQDYIYICHSDIPLIQDVLTDEITSNIRYMTNDIFRINFDDMTVALSDRLFNGNTYFAIPKPEKFDTLEKFIAALKYGCIGGKNRDKYTITKMKFDGEEACSILTDMYSTLRTGEYLMNFPSITRFISNEINKEDNRFESSIACRLIRMLDMDKESRNKEFAKLGITVTRDDVSLDNKDKISVDDYDKFMRPATFEEACNIFNVNLDVSNELSERYTDKYSDTKEKIDELQEILNGIKELDNLNKYSDELSKVENNTPEKETDTPDKETDSKVLVSVAITDDKTAFVNIVKESNSICVHFVSDDDIRIDSTETSYKKFINSGLNREALVGPLHRFMVLNESTYSIDDILKKLMID